ncbi:MAG: MoaD/ThiS family protein [Bacillota bacterium]|nr:MoaD/ThiS family protein [Bacillota bacterium]
MNVEVKLFATFRNGRFKKKNIEIDKKDTKVRDLLNELGIKEEEVALIIVNGIHSNVDRKLEEGDTLALFPPVAGG